VKFKQNESESASKEEEHLIMRVN